MDIDDTGQDGLAELIAENEACEAADEEFDAEVNGDGVMIASGAHGYPRQTRPETGPMIFGDDWPGLFIRGDNALYFAMVLGEHLDNCGGGPIEGAVLKGLAASLASVRMNGEWPKGSQRLRSFFECQDSKTADLISMKELERKHILRVLELVEGNKTKASKVLGLDRRTLYRRLHSYGVM